MIELGASQVQNREIVDEANTYKAWENAVLATLEAQLRSKEEWLATFLLSKELQ